MLHIQKPDIFLVILTFKSHKRKITLSIKEGYDVYFGCQIVDQDKNWRPIFAVILVTAKLQSA